MPETPFGPLSSLVGRTFERAIVALRNYRRPRDLETLVTPAIVELEGIRAELAAKDATIERLTEVQRRDRACLFGIYKTNARLRAALEHAASYMVTLCMDRPVHEDGEVVGHWQTVDWLIGLRELAEESHSIALSSLPPSDMRLVPVEVLKKIDLVAREAICGAASGNLLLEVVAKALGTHPNCAPSNMAVVLVERLREIEWCLPGPGGQRCPVCCYMRDGHAPDCWLAAAIRDAEREKA